MSEKKYELTGDTIATGWKVLHRVRALKDFGDVCAGALGGYIESENNLAHVGNAWVFGDAEVSGNAQVYGNGQVYGDARVYGNAEVYGNGQVYGDARVFGNGQVYNNAQVRGYAQVYGNAQVYSNACVRGNAKVYNNARVRGYAQVYGNARVFGNAEVSGNAEVRDNADWLAVAPIGSSNDCVTFYRLKDGGIGVRRGCFCGNLDEFLTAVNTTHGTNAHGLAYRAAVALARIRIGGAKE